MRILFIHGRAQGMKDKDALRHIWISALETGLARAGKTLPSGTSIDFPFYGKALDTYSAQADLPLTEDVLSKGGGGDPELEQFLGSVLTDMYERSELTQAEVEAEFPADQPLEKGPMNLRWVQAIVRAIDTHFPGLSEKGIEIILRDVFLYVNSPFVQDGIDQIVEETLTDEPTVVVGHSLGTVVGYNIIAKHQASRHFCKYISLGCPLGIQAIAARIGVAENTARLGWYNAYDERDIVALNPLDDTYFPTDPAIENNNGVDNRTSNRHGIIGYLEDAKVAGAIADALAEHQK